MRCFFQRDIPLKISFKMERVIKIRFFGLRFRRYFFIESSSMFRAGRELF